VADEGVRADRAPTRFGGKLGYGKFGGLELDGAHVDT
jgi:hypothetical protein